MTTKKLSVVVAARFTSVLVILGLVGCEKERARPQNEELAAHLRELAETFRKNQQDTKPLEEIIEILNGDWSFAKTYACDVLRKLGPLAAPAVPDLIKAVNCGDIFVEREAPRALAAIGEAAAPAVPVLIAKVELGRGDSAWFSAEALGEIGEPALVAIPVLEVAAQSEDELLADSAKQALNNLRKLQKTRGK